MYSNLVNMIDEKIQELTSKMAYVGSVQSALDLYDEMNLKMIDTVNRGVGRLVDADMAEESARLRAHTARLAVQMGQDTPKSISPPSPPSLPACSLCQRPRASSAMLRPSG